MFKFFLIGMAIGMADLVPGVSGGTIALVLGVYQRLLAVLSRVNPSLFLIWRRKSLRSMLLHVDIGFLMPLLAGAACSIFLFAKTINFLFANHLILLNSFFSGLIVASLLILFRKYKCFAYDQLFCVLLFAAIVVFISLQSRIVLDNNLWSLFIAGGLAACAAILPGISGSFILLLLGYYNSTLQALVTFDWGYLLVLAGGGIFALMTFSKLLVKLINQYSYFLYPSFLGLMLGGLFKLWPWSVKKSSGFGLLSPMHYTSVTGNDNQILLASLTFLCGFALIFNFRSYLHK